MGNRINCEVCNREGDQDRHPCRFEAACSCWRGQPCNDVKAPSKYAGRRHTGNGVVVNSKPRRQLAMDAIAKATGE